MARKRDGGEGQQQLVVPLIFCFNVEAIQNYMSHKLPEGILIENTHRLLELGYIQPLKARKATQPALDGPYMLKYPEAAPTT